MAKRKTLNPAFTPFVSIKEVGRTDANGRVAIAMGYGGRVFGRGAHQLSNMAIPVIEALQTVVSHESVEAAEKDLSVLKKYVAGLMVAKSK